MSRYYIALCVIWGVLMISLLPVPLISVEAQDSVSDTGFMYGLSWQQDDRDIQQGVYRVQQAVELGADSIRVNILWRSVEPSLLPKQADYDVDWGKVDSLVDSWTGSDLRIIARIGDGLKGDTPSIGDGEYLNPDIVGKDDYIYYVCRHIRHLVSRYRDRIHYWSIEAELNESPLMVLFGWRVGNAWSDEVFLTNLTQAMYNTVKSVDGSAQVVIGFHTDIHENIHYHSLGASIAGSKSWKDWVREWDDFMDIVGLHTYPNYYMADPMRGQEVGLRVEEAKEITDKPVIVTETAYPAPKPGDILPDPMDFTEEKQAQYTEIAFNSVRSAGGSGFFHFGVQQAGVRNDYSASDLDALRILGPAFHDGDVDTLIGFVMGNFDYTINELPYAIKNADWGLSLVREDGSKRPAFYILRDKYTASSPSSSYTQLTSLSAGWNTFSLSTQPGSTEISEVLQSIDGKYKSIWTYVNGTWLWYLAGSPNTSNLRSIRPGVGYWIEMLEPAMFTIDGTSPDTEVHLTKGWNLVGYPHNAELHVYDCMNSILGKYRSVWGYDQGAGWKFYLSDESMPSNLHFMRPGFAYWIEVTENCIWNVAN